MANSYGREYEVLAGVVNCFQISNFVLWQTAPNGVTRSKVML